MQPTIRRIIAQINLLNVFHRVLIHGAASDKGMHFGQPPVLEFIQDHPGCTQREIADHLRVSPPSIATSVKRMQRAGLLKKQADEEDMRRTRLFLTPKGEGAVGECRAAFDQVDQRMLAGFSEEEQQTLLDYLERMTENLSGKREADPGLFHSLLAQDRAMREKEEE